MNSEEVWINILIPLLFGQLFLYLKTLYDNYLAHKNEQKKIKFDEELNNVKHVLENLYCSILTTLYLSIKLQYSTIVMNIFQVIVIVTAILNIMRERK